MTRLCVGAPAAFIETTPFVSGQEGYHTYRIPAIVRATNGHLLAFCEGRKNSSGDAGDIDLVLRRSTNNGASWLPMQLVQEEGGTASITIGNPAPVVDETTGEIHLLFCRNNSRVFHTKSSDNGLTWSSRVELTSAVKLPEWGWYATGPGHGVQLRRGTQSGRLVVPCDFVTTNSVRGAHVVFSDDHGATWQLGAINSASGGVNPNETICEELVGVAPGGGSRVYFNTRDQGGSAAGTRGQAWSLNGGSTFAAPFTNRTAFVCPVVQGSLVRVAALDRGGATNRLLFSCPNHASSRVAMSIWSSFDESVNWGEPKLIWEGPSAYSDMAMTASGEVGLLYERGASSPYEAIAFARFNEAWLDDAGPAPENPGPAFWNMEEKAAGRTADTTPGAIKDIHPAGMNHHLTAQAAFQYVAGAPGYGAGSALSFDGTGGLQLADNKTQNQFDFGPTNSFTIEVVFRIPQGSTQTGSLVAKDYGPVLPSWWLRVESGKPRFLVSDNALENSVLADVLLNDAQWHHIAAVRDTRIQGTKLLRLYIDGVLVTNKVDATTGSLANSQPLNIGRFGAASTRNLTGDIDLVRITPRALAPSEFVGMFSQFDSDADGLPDAFEREATESLAALGGGDADADGDGAPDLLEFCMGSDPLDAASTPALRLEPGAASVRVSHHQRALPMWLSFHLYSSVDLRSWTECAGEVQVVPVGNGLWERSETVAYPILLPDALFYRIAVKQLP
jgi:sialidase-1